MSSIILTTSIFSFYKAGMASYNSMNTPKFRVHTFKKSEMTFTRNMIILDDNVYSVTKVLDMTGPKLYMSYYNEDISVAGTDYGEVIKETKKLHSESMHTKAIHYNVIGAALLIIGYLLH